MTLDDEMPAMLLPDFFGSGGGVTPRATGIFDAAPEAVDLSPTVAGRSGTVRAATPLAVDGLVDAAGDVAAGSVELAGDCQSGGAVTATKLRHLGHSMICPTTAGS
jgi:hypothetical protein